MHEIGVEELFAVSADQFVRHQVDPTLTTRVWALGGAVVVEGTTAQHRDSAPGPVLTCLGPPGDLGPLMSSVAASGPAPWRVTVEDTSYAEVPSRWRQRDPHRWHWMTTRAARRPRSRCARCPTPTRSGRSSTWPTPARSPGPAPPESSAGSGGRPSGPSGANPALAGVGALVRQADGTGHLRAVSVRPEHLGRGLGRAVSAALTCRALAQGSGVATLGVFTDNAPALRIYPRLGYRTVHTFVSGEVAA